MTTDTRAEFEASMRAEGFAAFYFRPDPDVPHCYDDDFTQCRWEGWNLARQSPLPTALSEDAKQEPVAWKIPTIDGPPKKPNKTGDEQIDCLVLHKRERKHLVWNCEYLVWDDAGGDDFYCEPSEVEAYIEFNSLPPIPTISAGSKAND